MYKSILLTTTSVVSFFVASNVYGADLVRDRLIKSHLKNHQAIRNVMPPSSFSLLNNDKTSKIASVPKLHLGKLSSNFSWQGFYVGAEIGKSISKFHNAIARSEDDHDGDQAVLDATYGKPKGIMGGGYAGYNRTLSHKVIAGIDADLDLSKSEAKIMNNKELLAHYEEGYKGAVRARLAYDGGRILPYVAGGVSVVGIKAAKGVIEHNKLNGVSIKEKMAVGYNVGGGFDYALSDHMLVRADYRYQDIKSPPIQSVEGGNVINDTAKDLTLKSHNIRFGLAYKF